MTLKNDRRRAKYHSQRVEIAQQTKAAAIARYGGACTACGLTDLRFLSIFDGKERRVYRTRAYTVAARWKRILTGPIDAKLKVLCFNCRLGSD